MRSLFICFNQILTRHMMGREMIILLIEWRVDNSRDSYYHKYKYKFKE